MTETMALAIRDQFALAQDSLIAPPPPHGATQHNRNTPHPKGNVIQPVGSFGVFSFFGGAARAASELICVPWVDILVCAPPTPNPPVDIPTATVPAVPCVEICESPSS